MRLKKKKQAYITKRLLVSKSSRAMILASHKAMEIVGYTIKVHKGWVVKEFEDGSIEKIKELDSSTINIILD